MIIQKKRFDTVYCVDSMGNTKEYVLSGIRSLATVDGVVSEKKFDEICRKIMTAYDFAESAFCDPDADYNYCLAKFRTTLREFMMFADIKYVLQHAAADPKNFQGFLIAADYAISNRIFLRAINA